MTDLIPRDAAIGAIERWWMCSQTTWQSPMTILRAIPTIDPAAMREAALEACTIIDAAAKDGHENPLDLILHLLTAVEPARRILALIGEKK